MIHLDLMTCDVCCSSVDEYKVEYLQACGCPFCEKVSDEASDNAIENYERREALNDI